MPLQLNGLDQFDRLLAVERFIYATAPRGDTTLTGAVAKGASVFPLTSSTNFADDDYFLVQGADLELNQVNGTPALNMPSQYKAAFAHAAGTKVVEMVRADLGHIGQGGVSFGSTLALNPINVATARAPIAYTRGIGEMTANISLVGFNGPNLNEFFGMDENETGAGTAVDPYQTAISARDIGNHGIRCYRFKGTLTDGITNAWLDLLGVTMTPNGNATLGGGNIAELPVSMRFANIVLRIFQ